MRIASLKLENYKCFLSSPEIRLTSGFNVIVGKNNSGKTALVETLSLRFGDNPHRSVKTIPYPGATPQPASIAHISFELDKEEFLNLLIDNSPVFYVCMDPNKSQESEAQRFLDAISERNVIKCVFQSGGFVSAYLEAYGGLQSDRAINFRISRGDMLPQATGISGVPNQWDMFAYGLTNVLRNRIYMFRAERLNVGQYQVGPNPLLKPDASNLAQVLNFLLSSNPGLFRRLNQYASTVFPEITQLTIPPIAGNSPPDARIEVWTTDPDLGRNDLAVPLQESGTGIGQVLAMLYVVLTSDYSRTIIIDEPQSFLHPGAVRKLFDILRQHPQHQYIITTHSPTAVMAADPQTIVMVRKREAESVVEVVDAEDNKALSLYLSEIGARLSDVFGADNILWVEGTTEEQCFPLILSKIENQLLLGTRIIGVVQTGDFEGKRSRTVFEIYRRLSEGRGLLPPAIGFIFDREGRNEIEIADLERQGRGCVHFTLRRMFENYLLNPRAIAHVMSSTEGFRDTPVTVEGVESWLQREHWDKRYFETTIDESERTNEVWLTKVHAAKVLADIFVELSENCIVYNKIEHGLALTTWIVENSPEDLKELAVLIRNVLIGGAVA